MGKGEFQENPQDVAIRAQPLIERLVAMKPRPRGVFCMSDDLMLVHHSQAGQNLTDLLPVFN